jgi:hypothetical protein
MFAFIDSPGNDAQYLSAARACFDKGDIECARENYEEISSLTDQIRAEQAFSILEEAGAGFEFFLDSLGSGQGASGITAFANGLIDGAGMEKRLQIFEAFQYVDEIENTELRGLVRFISGVALMAELLAEGAGINDGDRLEPEDLVTDPATCTTNALLCAANCTPTSEFAFSGNPIDLLSDPVGGQALEDEDEPDLDHIMNAVEAIDHAMNVELQAEGGAFSEGIGGFAGSLVDLLGAINPGDEDECFRWALLDLGVGE